jgi:hypothetical protein
MSHSIGMVEEVAEPSASVLDLPTVPTIRRGSPAESQPALNHLSTYPTQRDRSDHETSGANQRLGSTGASMDSTTLSVIDTSWSLDGVELNAADVNALFKM